MIPVSICVSYVWHTAKMHNAIQYRYNIPFRIRELTSSQRGDPIGNRPFIPRRARRYSPFLTGRRAILYGTSPAVISSRSPRIIIRPLEIVMLSLSPASIPAILFSHSPRDAAPRDVARGAQESSFGDQR